MGIKRDNFSTAVKLALAQRVAYRCSYPSCPNKTIGPHNADPEQSMSVGEAAHIHAAAPLGPRYVKTMTPIERSGIENGIWLCRSHARIVDLDEITYTADVLRAWKLAAEVKAAKELLIVQEDISARNDTLICLDIDLMFTGVWVAANGNIWTFSVKEFLFGNIERLRSYDKNELKPMRRYVIIESQSEGRLLKEGFAWHINQQGNFEITVEVYPEVPRISLESLGGDIAHDYDGDLLVENGDFELIKGVDYGRQLIERNLGLPFGGWRPNQLMGSYFSMYYNQYQDNLPMLNRLVKIELIRLMSIPTYQTEYDQDTPLNFIRKINEVSVMLAFNDLVPVFLSLEWSDRSVWTDTIYVPLFIPGKEDEWEPPEFITKLFEPPPLQVLQKVTGMFKTTELKIKRTNETICRLFNDSLPAILQASTQTLESNVYPLFNNYEICKSIDNQVLSYFTSADIELAVIKRNVQQIGAHVYLRGFKRAGVDAFDVYGELFIYFDDYHYAIGGSKQRPWHKKLYDAQLGNLDIKAIAAQWIDHIANLISVKIKTLSIKS